MRDVGELEGIAQDLLDEARFVDEPTDAVALAKCCGFEIVWSGVCESVLLDPAIYIPHRTPANEVHGEIAHELGHWALRRLGLDDRDDDDANYLSDAIMMSRRWILPRLRPGWHLADLCRAHPWASAQMISRRIVQVREFAGAAFYEGARFRGHIGDPSARHPLERELAAEALETRKPVRIDACTGAWPIFEEGQRGGVIVLVAA